MTFRKRTVLAIAMAACVPAHGCSGGDGSGGARQAPPSTTGPGASTGVGPVVENGGSTSSSPSGGGATAVANAGTPSTAGESSGGTSQSGAPAVNAGTNPAAGSPAAGNPAASGASATAGGAPVAGGSAGAAVSGGGTSAAGDGLGGMPGGGGTEPQGGTMATGGSADPPDPDPNCGSHKWACWPMPNPVGSGLPNEASYTDNGDTVTDNITGLMWEKSAPGGDYTWDAALSYCDSLSVGGFDDWRLPTRVEMSSVMDYAKSGAKFPAEAFPGAQGGFHKTASDWILTIDQRGAGQGTDYAWAFNMSDGIVSNAYSKATASKIRCVRGNGQGEGPSEPAVPPPNLYTALNDDEVLDNYTGLIWQRRDSGNGLSWEAAGDYCATLDLGGNSWRLPSIRELATLVDEAQVAPAINREMFPDTKYGSRSNNWYWSSHRAQGSNSASWAINFDDGFTGFNAGSNGDWNYWTSAFARCVR